MSRFMNKSMSVAIRRSSNRSMRMSMNMLMVFVHEPAHENTVFIIMFEPKPCLRHTIVTVPSRSMAQGKAIVLEAGS